MAKEREGKVRIGRIESMYFPSFYPSYHARSVLLLRGLRGRVDGGEQIQDRNLCEKLWENLFFLNI
jgi:hypothetical protein